MERLHHTAGEVVGERHARVLSQCVGQNLEADVGVDAHPPRPGDRDRRIGTKTRCMGEEVTDGAPLGSGRLVEGDRAFLYGDEDSHGHKHLGHGSPGEGSFDVADAVHHRDADVVPRVSSQTVRPPDDAGSGGVDRPPRDEFEGAHGPR